MYNLYESAYMLNQGDEFTYIEITHYYRYIFLKMISDAIENIHFLKRDKDDILQEAYMTLYDCINRYREDGEASLKTFIHFCVQRRIKCYIRKMFSGKYRVLNNAVSIDDYVCEETSLSYFLSDNTHNFDPAYQYRYEEAKNKFLKYYYTLSESDQKLLHLAICRTSYQDAAKILNISKKQYDNRLQKMKRYIKELVL